MATDGQKQLESFEDTLSTATSYLKALIASSSSKAWKLVPPPSGTNSAHQPAGAASSSSSPKGRHSAVDPSTVVVHRRSAKGGDVWRASVEVDCRGRRDDWSSEGFRAVLGTPEARAGWDRMVESATTLEQTDEETRIVRTAFRLGWPSSPRDTVTVSRTVTDPETVVHISASPPPSDAPYLRPAPPYVRANQSLLAFCIQLPSSASPSISTTASPTSSPAKKLLRLTIYWQWDPKGSWAVGSGMGVHLPALASNLIDYAREASERIAYLSGFGKGVALSSTSFDVARDTLNLDYAIVIESEGKGLGRSGKVKERARVAPERTLEFAVPGNQGWRVQITIKSLVPEDDHASFWSALIGRSPTSVSKKPPTLSISTPSASFSGSPSNLTLRISHPLPPEPSQLLRVRVSIARDSSSKSIRINGVPSPIIDLPPPASSFSITSVSSSSSSPPSAATNALLSTSKRVSAQFGIGTTSSDDTASLSGVSLRTIESVSSSVNSSCPSPPDGDELDGNSRHRLASSESTISNGTPPVLERSEKANKSISSLIRRNYIYFLSLLQEPEAKWRHVLDAPKGVSVHQLDSIDRTLVLYRAEAVFVGVGIWDLLAAIASPSMRGAWDRGFEDSILLEDVNELSQLWWWKWKGSWPAYYPRDSVLLKTTYKSPNSVHVFSFSAEDHVLFPSVPTSDPSTIRTQVDLQGWSIEVLSPTTTQVTLLEQSDPKGWTKKGTIPQTMADMLAGIGEFAIRSGGPPIVTRLAHAKCVSSRYDLDKACLRFEYQTSERSAHLASQSTLSASSNAALPSAEPSSFPSEKSHRHASRGPVECELRCDTDTWSPSIDLVVDPPPISVTCLRRHKLSPGGGGSWLVVTHDPIRLAEDHVVIMVKKGSSSTSSSSSSSKDKSIVTVNGSKIKVDVEELSEAEVKTLSKQKRVKPARMPLDQPAVLGAVRGRNPSEPGSTPSTAPVSPPSTEVDENPIATLTGAAFRFASPFTRFLYPVAPSPVPSTVLPPLEPAPTLPPPSCALKPMQQALDALDSLRLLHTQAQDASSWSPASTSAPIDLLVEKRLVPHISTAFPVHRASRVIQGSTAEDVCSVVGNGSAGSRKIWDERFDSRTTLETFGNGCETAFVCSKAGGLVFRDRGFYLASVTARAAETSASTPKLGSLPTSSLSTIFHVSTSFSPDAAARFDPDKVNPAMLPIGTMFEGWVMETLDPYGNEKFIIPSTRLTFFTSVDYAGSMATMMSSNLNATLPRLILSVESYLKTRHSNPLLRSPATGLSFDARAADDLTAPASSATELKAWEMQGGDRERVVLGTSFDPVEAEWNASLFLRPKPAEDLPATDSKDSTSLTRPTLLQTPTSTTPPTEQNHIARRIVSSPTLSQPQVFAPSLASKEPKPPVISKPLRPSPISLMSRLSSSTITETSSSSRREEDFVVCRLELDTRSFPAGYNITSSAFLAPEESPLSTSTDSGPASSTTADLRLSLAPNKTTSASLRLPIKATVTLLPLPPTHSATLSSSPPRRKHLLTVTLPTAQYLLPPIADPLQPTPKYAQKKPAWLESLEKRGVVLEIKVVRLAGEAYEDEDGEGIGEMVVAHEGAMVEVEKRTRTSSGGPGLGAKAGDAVEGCAWPRVSRTLLTPGSSSNFASDNLPLVLSSPIAVAEHLLQETTSSISLIPTTIPTIPAGTVKPAETSKVTILAKSTAQPASPPTRKNSTASIPILSFFNPYWVRLSTPASPTTETPNKLGSTSLASAASDLASSSQDGQPPANPPLPSSSSDPSSSTALAATSTIDASPDPTFAPAISKTLPHPPSGFFSFDHNKHHPPLFSLPTVLLVALVSFLLGSLVRSLLSPADFIAFLPVAEQGEEVSLTIGGGGGELVGMGRGWRELRRLVEIKGIWGGDDLMVGVVSR